MKMNHGFQEVKQQINETIEDFATEIAALENKLIKDRSSL